MYSMLPLPFSGPRQPLRNLCRLPTACREYPLTYRVRMGQILDLTMKNGEICPAVQWMVEQFKWELARKSP